MVATSHHAGAMPQEIGIRVPEGFKIDQVASPELADDIYSLAVSSRGHVLVAGRGYIKRLVDSDADGTFDSSQMLSRFPANGAQGMLPLEDDSLICTGDQGILKLVDQNGDGLFDGRPKVLVSMKTGVEHGTHALRIGPDQKLYVLAGNATPISTDFFCDPASPVAQPHAGFLMCMDLDGSNKQIVADGFRNAYDFDFNSAGEIFVYDSDGERDIALPWYRPTRVYHVRAGDDAGWVTAGWKRPAEYLDMPQTIAKLGRGSPTGVCVYRKHCPKAKLSYPTDYSNAVFVGDWTFGRIVALIPLQDGTYQPIDFAQSNGDYGFAVTDLAIDLDGSLLVSVGGRGTRGAVYRISYQGDAAQRGETVSNSNAWDIRKRAHRTPIPVLQQAMAKNDEVMVTAVLEQLVRHPQLQQLSIDASEEFVTRLRQPFASNDYKRAGLVLRILQSMPQAMLNKIQTSSLPASTERAFGLAVELAASQNADRLAKTLVSICQAIPESRDREQQILLRLAQLTMQGGSTTPTNLMFSGYEPSRTILLTNDQRTDVLNALTEGLKKTLDGPGTHLGDHAAVEMGRIAAMACPGSKFTSSPSSAFETKVDQLITEMVQSESNAIPVPTLIHWLNVAAKLKSRSSSTRISTRSKTPQFASLIASVPTRLEATNQPIDRNFAPRLNHTVETLCDKDKTLASALAAQLSAEEASLDLWNVVLKFQKHDKRIHEILKQKINTFCQQRADDVTRRHFELWLMLDSPPAERIRSFADRAELRVPVVKGLARFAANDADLKLYVDTLGSKRSEQVRLAAVALRNHAKNPQLAQWIGKIASHSYFAMNRFGWSRAEIAAKDDLNQLLIAIGISSDYQIRQFKPDSKQKQRQAKAINKLGNLVASQHPDVFAAIAQDAQHRPSVDKLIGQISQRNGDARRGAAAYKKFRCAQCHDAGNRLGPRLEGIGKRFSQEDLVRSIVDPNDSVPDRYVATVLAMSDGTVIRGTVIYDSVAGVVIQKDDGMTATLKAEEIEERATSGSLMPEDLMKEATIQDWADLISWLQAK